MDAIVRCQLDGHRSLSFKLQVVLHYDTVQFRSVLLFQAVQYYFCFNEQEHIGIGRHYVHKDPLFEWVSLQKHW